MSSQGLWLIIPKSCFQNKMAILFHLNYVILVLHLKVLIKTSKVARAQIIKSDLKYDGELHEIQRTSALGHPYYFDVRHTRVKKSQL